MKDQKLKLRDLHVSHTLGCPEGVVFIFIRIKDVCTIKDVLLIFFNYKKVYFQQNKKRRRPRKGKCHSKSMMSNEDNEKLEYTLRMCHLGRTRRKKYEGRG